MATDLRATVLAALTGAPKNATDEQRADAVLTALSAAGFVTLGDLPTVVPDPGNAGQVIVDGIALIGVRPDEVTQVARRFAAVLRYLQASPEPAAEDVTWLTDQIVRLGRGNGPIEDVARKLLRSGAVTVKRK